MFLDANTSELVFVYNKYYRWYLYITSSMDYGEYTERHHIVPRCLGGSDDSNNIVSLSYRKHFLAHWLLTKCVKPRYYNKMLRAFTYMTRGKDRRCVVSWQYEVVKRARKDVAFSADHREAISNSLRGRVVSDATRALWSAQRKGVSKGPISKDQKERISATLLGRKRGVWINNGTDSTIIAPDMIPEGWVLGRLTKGRRAWNKGRPSPLRGKKKGPVSDEARANMCAAQSTPEAFARRSRVHSGKVLSETTRVKIAVSLMGRKLGCWITDGTSNRRIEDEEDVPDGWEFGMTRRKVT